MSIFDLCCQPKAKKSLDYVLKWIDETDIELKQIHIDISRLNSIVGDLDKEIKDLITEDLGPIFDEYARNYDYSSVIPELTVLSGEITALSTAVENKVDTPLTARSGRIAVWGEGKTLTEGSAAISDLAPVNHTHSVLGYNSLSDAMSYLDNCGVIFGGKSGSLKLTVVLSDTGEYTIDTVSSGEILARLRDYSVDEIFIPIRVSIDDEYHIGYYWTDGTNRSIHLEGLVFKYDTENSEWLPAQACVIGNQVPHWKKMQSVKINDHKYDAHTLYNLSNFEEYYAGLPIRLVPVNGDPIAIIPDIVLATESSPNRVYLSNSIDLDAIRSTYNTGTFDLYILDNADTLLKVDNTPVQYSKQLITSGAVYSAINSLEARIAALEAQQ